MNDAVAGQAFEMLVVANLALMGGIAAVLVLRRPVRQLFGARLAFRLWLLPLIAVVGVLLPGPYHAAIPAGLPSTADPAVPTSGVSTPHRATAPARSVPDPANDPSASMADQRSKFSPFWPVAFLWLWIVGGLLTGAVFLLRQWRFERLIQPLVPTPVHGEGVYRAVTTQVGAGLVGTLRPRIVVPADFETRFSPTQQRLVLDHEREHQRAGHAQLNALAAILQALFWLNPLVPFALRSYRLDQELACDAAVLASTHHTPRTYGKALLQAQTGALAPLGCAWRPPGGLHTRLTQLSRRAPGTARHQAGRLGLFLLIAAIGGASWAARPESQTNRAVPDEFRGSAPSVASEVTELQLLGLDAELTVLVEERAAPGIDGLAVEFLPVPTEDGLAWRLGAKDPEICQRTTSAAQRLVVRVPPGVKVTTQGRVAAEVLSPEGGTLRFEGCGTVHLADTAGAVDLTLAGSVQLTGGAIEGDLSLRGSQNARAEFVEVNGDLRLQTSGGARLDLAELNGSGSFRLSGGSVLSVERWAGPLLGSVAGGSEVSIEEIQAGEAEFTLSGAGSGVVEDGEIGALYIDQAARAQFTFGGVATTSRVRNRGDTPVVLAQAGELDSKGLISTRWIPPDG